MPNSDQPRAPSIVRIILHILLGWLPALIAFFLTLLRRYRGYLQRWRQHKWEVRCRTYPSDIWLRPDVYIYSQKWLMARGIAVTWDNPDIEFHRRSDGALADSHNLQPDTDYDIIAKVHNRSPSGPAFGVRVVFSLRSWGVNGPELQHIGETSVDVSVLGGAENPALAKVGWRTPPQAGHYCLLVSLHPPDDLDWDDNEGQENTNVRAANPGPGDVVRLTVPVFNPEKREIRARLAVDAYRIPVEPLPLDKTTEEKLSIAFRRHNKYLSVLLFPPRHQTKTRRQAMEARRQAVAKVNGVGNFPQPLTWQPRLEPDEVAIPPASSRDVVFSIRVPDDAKKGTEQQFNVNAFDSDGRLLGGITLRVRV